MADKQIIIEVIDVSECYGYVHNAKEYDCGETYSKFHYRYCEENPNCYFKQLKRKEQECEELKKECERLKNELSTYGATGICETCTEKSVLKCDQLEKENEKLKKKLQAQRNFTAQEQRKIYCVAYDESCKTGNDCKQKKCIFKDNIKLKQTLAEIIRFLKEDKKFARYSGYPIVLTSIVLEEIEKILKENDIKISEVEN